MPVPRAGPTYTALLTSPSGEILSWNASCEALFGRSADAALNQSLPSLLVVQDAPGARWRWADTSDLAVPLAVQIPRPDGSCKQAEMAVLAQCDSAGAPSTCIAIFIDHQQSEVALIASIPLSTVIDVLPGTFYVIRPDGTFALWNRQLEIVSGMSSEEILQAHALDMFDLVEKSRIAARLGEVFEQGKQIFVEADYRNKQGQRTPYLLCGARIECRGKFYLCGMGLDMSQRRHDEESLRRRERALHASSTGLVITRCAGADNPIEYVNPAFERMTGYSAHESIGRDPRFMAVPGEDQEQRAVLREAIAQRREAHVTLRNRRKNGEIYWNDLSITPVADATGKVNHYIGVTTDITASRQRTAELEHEINHDALTGLANRNLLWDRLDQALHMAQRHKTMVAIVLLDLDGFKQINDTYGHEAGDRVLTVVAKRLQAAVRENDTVARLSGDEFVLVLVNQPSLRYTLRMIERLRSGMATPAVFDHTEIDIGSSMGVSVYPHDGNSAAELVRAADVAMYHAKSSRDQKVHFYSADMKSTTDARQQREHDLRHALDNDELFLIYQPRMCLHSGRLSGIEALLRWQHPQYGLILPAHFLSDANESGLIVDIGRQVLDMACAFLAMLQKAGITAPPLAINVSHGEYSRNQFVDEVGNTLSRHGVAPEQLEVEMREDSLYLNRHVASDVLARLHELGVLRSLDGFGAGSCDLGYLQHLPLSCVKVAAAAVHQISAESHRGVLAKSLIDIGHNLGAEVVAKAVETQGQLDFLKAQQCDEIQGTVFSEPLSREAMQAMLAAPSL